MTLVYWLGRYYNAGGSKADRKEFMLEFVLVFAVLALVLGGYWTLFIFPKQRAFQHKQKVVRSLHVGDEVITYGGLIGKIMDIDAEQGVARVEIADGVTIRLITAALQQVYDPKEIAYHAKMGIEPQQPEQIST